MSGTLIQEMIEFAEKESDERAKKAQAFFMEYCKSHGIELSSEAHMSDVMTAGWSEQIGREDEHVAVRGKLSDLIIVGRPVTDNDSPSPATLNAALFETGRAVIVTPPEPPVEIGKRIVIFWRGSTEASRAIRTVPYRELHKIQKDMAIVIPVKGERLKLIEGVLCGIPHPCLTIVVSNSPRRAVDRFSIEKEAVHDFCNFVSKKALIVHQKDPALASPPAG